MKTNIARGVGRKSAAFVAAPSEWSHRTRRLVLSVLGLVLVASLVMLGLGYKLYSEDRSREEERRGALAAATQNVATLLSYDSVNADQQFKSKYELLTGKFKEDFIDMSEKTIIPLAKEQKVTTKAQVSASGVISSDADRVDVLLFVNQSTTRGDDRTDTSLQGSRVKVGLVRTDGRWAIDGMTPV